MPKIIGHEEQMAAFNDIKDALKDMKTINKFLEKSSPNAEYTISFKDEEGHKQSITIAIPDKEFINDLIHSHKKEIADKMVEKARNHRIELEPEELAIFGIEQN